MLENCQSGSMSGLWKRSMVGLVRHRQTKEPATDRPYLNHRATSRLYNFGVQSSFDADPPDRSSRVNVLLREEPDEDEAEDKKDDGDRDEEDEDDDQNGGYSV
jgi:hypothetical protein